MGFSKIALYKKNANNEKYAVIYYRHDGPAIRLRTGVTVNEKDFDKKTLKVKKSDTEHIFKNKVISEYHSKIEDIIDNYYAINGIKPTSVYVKKQFESGVKFTKSNNESTLMEFYEEFYQTKNIEFNSPDKSIKSLRDYKSLRNALIDFEKVNGEIALSSITNIEWLFKFNNFLASERPYIKDYVFKTSKQKDKTRNKRFSVLKTFAIWLDEKGILKDATKALEKFKIRVIKKVYYTLSLKELKTLQETIFEVAPEQKAIDMFVFACHTGVRFGDLIRIKKHNILQKNDLNILSLHTEKTDEYIEVPLTVKANSILIKYHYNLSLMTSQKANKYLHSGLSKIEFFKDEYGYNQSSETKPKYKLITFQTGRRAFVTNLVNNNINLNAIMKMTGHRKLSTLQQYINPDYELMKENIKIFNEL